MSGLREFNYAWEWQLAATPSALWPLVSDTNRFNRDAGVPAVEEAGASAGARKLKMRRYGVLIEWEEEPFEWVRPRSFGVVRRYSSGPVAEMRVLTELEAVGDDATRVRYLVTAKPRNVLGFAAIPFEIGLISARRFEAVFRRYAEEARRAAAPALPGYAQQRIDMRARPATLAPGGAERLASIRTALLGQFDAAFIDRLIDVVQRGEDLCVARLRAYVLADAWQAPRRSVLDLCLHATRAGLLDLQWDVLCPMCRGAKQSNSSLRGVSQPVHCESCNIDFYANFEQSVELTFRVNAAIRNVEVFPFCVGGPQLTPHIVVQQRLPANETKRIRLELSEGRYRVRSSGLPGGQLFRVARDGAAVLSLEASSAGWNAAEPLAQPVCECELRNSTGDDQLFIIERVEWSDQALTAAEVIALQEFRDLFSSEALRPGEAINVGSMTILFTDLRGSTRLYREIGDAPAFGRVLDHFDVLRQAMQAEEGALVKTIGDAVMAVFRRPVSAVRTVLRAQQLLAGLPEGVCSTNLKAGIHYGPCIAVTLNDRLDYFGSTVNTAARVGSLSDGGELVISEAVAADPEVQQLLSGDLLMVERFEARLKGLDDMPLGVLRLRARP